MNQREIAKLAGVSSATISRVINNDPKVSPKTYRKVKEVIDKYGYVENGMAKNLRTSKTRTIGYLISNLYNPFFQAVYAGIERVCKENRYQIIIGSTNEDIQTEEDAVGLMLAYRVDGIIASFVNPSEIIRRQLKQVGVELVLLDRKIPSLQADSVMIDNINGAVDQVKYLSGLGHKKIAVIRGTLYNSPGVERLEGFRKGMKECGIPILKGYEANGEFTEEGGYEAVERLMKLSNPPTAIIVHNNLMCIGAYKALRDMKLRIPEDVSLIGFDDFDLAVHLHPQITVIDRPTEEMGEMAMNMLLDRFSKKTEDGALRHHVFPAALCVRESCGRPRKGGVKI